MSVDWFPELQHVSQLPGTLAFCYAGAVHRTTTALDEFVDAVALRRPVVRVGLDDEGLLRQIEHGADDVLWIVDPTSDRFTSARVEERLSNLRPLVQQARTRGVSILFLSSKPLSRYPVLAGSSILADAETVRIRPLDDHVAEQFVLGCGVGPTSAQRIVGFARGSRALLEAFVEADLSNGSGNAKLSRASELETAVALQAFEELGSDLVTLIEHWVYEAQLTSIDQVDFPNDAVQTALVLSGTVSHEDDRRFALLPFKNRSIWIDALARWISCVVQPPDSWSQVAAELFSLERFLRLHAANDLADRHGSSWRSEGLESLSVGILELARRDGVPAVTSLEDLRGPLDWIQLSDLLDLAGLLAGPSSWLGLRAPEWEKVALDLLPTRHRIAHMRLVRAGDLELVRHTRRLIEVRGALAR